MSDTDDTDDTSDTDASPAPAKPGLHVPEEWKNPGGAVALLGAVGLLLYGIARVSAERFYESLGLRLEELQLGYPGVLEQALGMLALTMVLAGATWLILLLFAVFLARVWPEIQQASNLAPKQIAFLFVASFIAVLVLSSLLSGSINWTWLLVVAVFPISLAVVFARGRVPPGVLAAYTLLTVAAFFGVLMWSSAVSDSERVRAGKGTADVSLRVSLVPWHGTVARISPASPLPPGLGDLELGCVIKLAETERGTIVHAVTKQGLRGIPRGERRTVTVRPEAGAVSLIPGSGSCRWPPPS